MDNNSSWFRQFRNSDMFTLLHDRPIVYFCTEFALSGGSPTYAGGLGILAGDMVREAAEQQIPFVAIGIYYHEGYLHHELYDEGTLLKHPKAKKPEEFGFTLVTDEKRQPVIITIPLQGRMISVQAWEMNMGTVRFFLLDTDLSQNEASDRNITNRLYITNKEVRFKQEMVLGIGGVKLLEALRIHPLLYHMNEGHSALLALQVAYHEMKEYNSSFVKELERTKHHILFTNHTLVPAGNDMFNSDMVAALLNDYAVSLQMPVQEIVKMGLVAETSIFSMTVLALRMATRVNAVSKLHAEKAKDIWPNYDILAVTNGVHIGTWDKMKTNDLWQAHQENKKILLALIQKQTGQTWNPDHLLLGWARRMVAYKRPLALFQNPEVLLRILHDEKRPVNIVIAGSAHESDLDGAKMLESLQELIADKFKGHVVYLPNYAMDLAKTLIAGCDVWMNTPVVGFEACGTSGMKACLNGVLPLSTKDGWVYEFDTLSIGWIADSENITDSLLSKIDKEIVPLYYYRDREGVPGAWIENMQHARELILNEYSATRMLRQYFEYLYLPAIQILRNGH